MHRLTRSEIRWWKNVAIKSVVSLYDVDLAEAREENYSAYPSFNHFFTRELKESARPIHRDEKVVVSPADGVISEIGTIEGGRILQAKDRRYNLTELLGGDRVFAAPFECGNFVTIYLSPRDYHRLHMPCSGTLLEMRHVPGRLFSVNRATTAFVPDLFAKNERIIATFRTPLGKMALVLVGAIFVSSIETVWHGVVTPPSAASVRIWNYGAEPVRLAQGQEMGRFNMGSTVIVLFESGKIAWSPDFEAETPVKMGESIGAARPAQIHAVESSVSGVVPA